MKYVFYLNALGDLESYDSSLCVPVINQIPCAKHSDCPASMFCTSVHCTCSSVDKWDDSRQECVHKNGEPALRSSSQ